MPIQFDRVGSSAGLGPASLAFLAAILLLMPVSFSGALDSGLASMAIDWLQVAMLIVGVVFAWRIVALDTLTPLPRRGFILLALALLVLLVGDTAWAWIDSVRGENPSNSIANWIYLPFYPLILAGVIAFPRIFHSAPDRARFLFDVMICTIGIALPLWHFLMRPGLPALSAPTDSVAVFVVLVQPLLDSIAALAVTIILLRLPSGRAARPMLWLALGLTLNFLGNLVLAVLAANEDFATGGIADVLWIGSRWCFLASADSQFRLTRAVCDSLPLDFGRPSFQALPYFAVAAGYGTALLDATDGVMSNASIFGAILLTMLVLLRQRVDRQESETSLAEGERRIGNARLAALVQHASEAIVVLDREYKLLYASPAMARLIGSSSGDLIGAQFQRFLHPDESLAAESVLRIDPRPEGARRVRLRLYGAHGWIWTQCTVTHLLHQPEVAGIVLNVRDVSAERELEEQLRHQSFHDPLTGLINRLLFGERISEALSERRSDGTSLAVMFVDLDHFKMVNDGLGHASGDAVICEAAVRLQRAVRDRDVLARLGGDEFAILLHDVDDDDEVSDTAQRVMETFREPFRVDGREIAVSASLGIAWAGVQETVDVLMRNADLALNEAKARGRDRFHVFQPDLHATVLRKLQLHEDLRRILERDDFFLMYQPIFQLDSLQPVGIEALLRWPQGVGLDAGTEAVISAAEESGFIVPLGRWVLERALEELQEIGRRHAHSFGLRLTVNLSARQLQDPELPDLIATALQERGIAPSRLVLELTETALAEHPDEALAALNRLKAVGVRLAIDDFGTGYSSLAQLARFPFDLLKVPKPFVDMIDGEFGGSRLALAVLALGESLHLQTIAEGIETEAQLKFLQASGCELAQGFLLAHPLGLDELCDLIKASRIAA